MSDYDTDFVAWSEHQAALLRRLAAGEQINDQVDWVDVVEEIESVGNDQRHAVTSLLTQTMTHILNGMAWPHSGEVPHWNAAARRFRDDAIERFAQPMRRRIDMTLLCRRALRAMPESIDGQPPLSVPETCPFTLDELLTE